MSKWLSNILKCGGSHTLKTVFFISGETYYYSGKSSLMLLFLCFPPYKQQTELNSQITVELGEEEQTLTCTYKLHKDLPLILPKTTFWFSALVSLYDLNQRF